MRRSFGSSDRGQVDDETLHQLITEAIDNDSVFWNGRGRKAMIIVEVDDGMVTLNGFARSPAEKRRADIIARALGAGAVDNRLRLYRDAAEQPD